MAKTNDPRLPRCPFLINDVPFTVFKPAQPYRTVRRWARVRYWARKVWVAVRWDKAYYWPI